MFFAHSLVLSVACLSLFFFNDTATTEIYTLSLHDALPIFGIAVALDWGLIVPVVKNADEKNLLGIQRTMNDLDRKSTRLNSSHSQISYAVFCLKKKK